MLVGGFNPSEKYYSLYSLYLQTQGQRATPAPHLFALMPGSLPVRHQAVEVSLRRSLPPQLLEHVCVHQGEFVGRPQQKIRNNPLGDRKTKRFCHLLRDTNCMTFQVSMPQKKKGFDSCTPLRNTPWWHSLQICKPLLPMEIRTSMVRGPEKIQKQLHSRHQFQSLTTPLCRTATTTHA